MQIPTPPANKSLVRLKGATVFLIFVACWLWLKYISSHENLVFSIAAITAILPWFLRCERCKSSIYYRAGGVRMPRYSLSFFTARQCPCCGLERA